MAWTSVFTSLFYSPAVRLVGGVGRKQLSRCVYRSWAVFCGPFLPIILGVTIGGQPEFLALSVISRRELSALHILTLVAPELMKGRCTKHSLCAVCRCWQPSARFCFEDMLLQRLPWSTLLRSFKRDSCVLVGRSTVFSRFMNDQWCLFAFGNEQAVTLTDYDPRLCSPLSQLTLSSYSGPDTVLGESEQGYEILRRYRPVHQLAQ